MKKNSKRFQIENNVLIRCNTDARKVVIPEEVTEIGDYAFYCHFNLVSVTIPKGVKKIGKKAFFGCARKSGSEIIGNIQIIGDFADQSLVTIVYKGSKSQWEKVEGSEQDDLKDIVVFDA